MSEWKKYSILKNKKGMTLIEVMIAFSIMAVVLLSAMYCLYMAQMMSQESRDRLLALNAARSVVEVIKDTPLANVTGINTSGYVPSDLKNGAIAIATNPANLAGVTIATVTVTVTWTGPRNMARALEVTTMRSIY